MRPLGVIGHLSRDLVAGAPARIGGGPWHAARALRMLRHDAIVFAKCGEPEQRDYRRRLAALGLPASVAVGGDTTQFSFSYAGDGTRTMAVDVVGEPWRRDDVPQPLLRRVEWLHVAPLLRGDFAAEEAEAVGDLGALGVAEILVTYGARGARVIAGGEETHVAARDVHADPTGAGDAFAVTYLAARADGHRPVSAARRATALVAALLGRWA